MCTCYKCQLAVLSDLLFGQKLELGDDIAQTTSYEWTNKRKHCIDTPLLRLKRPIKLSLLVKNVNQRKMNSH